MTGLLLHLAGPMQSWGTRSRFSERDTAAFPTRSGITGILAAAEGVGRGEPLDRYAPLAITVRADRPGTLLEDFHTAGGGLPRHRSIPTASGGRRPEGTAVVATRRRYLADAVFTAALEGPADLIRDLAAALRAPRWQPYLGRRACMPAGPLLLRTADDPAGDLRTAVPLPPRPVPPAGTGTGAEGTVTVTMISEAPPADGSPADVTELADVPGPPAPDRQFAQRAVYSSDEKLPAALAGWPDLDSYRQALARYARSTP